MTEYSVEKFYSEYALKKEDSIIAVFDSGTNARKVCDKLNELSEENEQLKKEKQGILKRIDEYIWAWEDEGTPVADEMRQLKNDIEKGYLEW